jgi:hypothetical protein
MNHIVSSIPGRIRVRNRELRDQKKLNQLLSRLEQIGGISRLQGNVRTGSILLRFDSAAISLSAIEVEINAAVYQIVGNQPKPATSISMKSLNRYNKLAMLASLGFSLTVTKFRIKRWRRWHTLTGYLFAANLGVHLYIYRKSLLRLFR